MLPTGRSGLAISSSETEMVWGIGGSWLQLDRVRSEAAEMQRYLVIWPAPLVFNQWINLSNEIMKIMTWAA